MENDTGNSHKSWRRLAPPLALSVIYLAVTLTMLIHALHVPKISRKIIEGDSEAYVAIARDLAAGDFGMSYVKHWPHRQPLYPLALAGAMKLAGDRVSALVGVNILFGLLLVLSIYFGLLRLFHDPLLAALVACSVPLNRFLMDYIPRHLVTEPLFVLLTFAAICVFLAYLRDGARHRLWLAATLCGLAYLTRPNGLFLMTAMAFTLLVHDLVCLGQTNAPFRKDPLLRLLGAHAIAILCFVVITAPSWWPRWHWLGNPLSHGYVSNYLFVDDYAIGHSHRVRYHASDYLATHNALDFAARWLRGFWQVYVRVPIWIEEWAILYLLSVAGLWVALRGKEKSAYRWLALWMFLELLPLVWTNLSNPTGRVPYAAMLPFLFIFAAVALQPLLKRYRTHALPGPILS